MHRSLLAVSLGLSLGIVGAVGAPAAAPSAKPAVADANTSTNLPPGGGTNAAGTIVGVIDAETRDLRPHDVFRYRIEQDPVPGTEPLRVVITDSGEAHFNVSRGHSTYVTVKAAGRRIADVRKDLKEKLDAEYYLNATVRLDLEGVNSAVGSQAALAASMGKVQIFGEMQGTIPIPESGRLMLSDVILGLARNDFANLKKIRVKRYNSDGQPETHTVDIDKVLNDNDRSADFELKDGDRINVPRKFILGL